MVSFYLTAFALQRFLVACTAPLHFGIVLEQALKETWFRNRDCLDVGCHEGLLTLEVVAKYCPKSMMGIDIDHALSGKRAKKWV